MTEVVRVFVGAARVIVGHVARVDVVKAVAVEGSVEKVGFVRAAVENCLSMVLVVAVAGFDRELGIGGEMAWTVGKVEVKEQLGKVIARDDAVAAVFEVVAACSAVLASAGAMRWETACIAR